MISSFETTEFLTTVKGLESFSMEEYNDIK